MFGASLMGATISKAICVLKRDAVGLVWLRLCVCTYWVSLGTRPLACMSTYICLAQPGRAVQAALFILYIFNASNFSLMAGFPVVRLAMVCLIQAKGSIFVVGDWNGRSD